jgi:hypothetical protein
MAKDKPKNSYSAPLRPGDTPRQTVGCRLTNPEICNKHSMESVCAFGRADGVCLAPPTTWAKRYATLLAGAECPVGGLVPTP